MGGPGSGPRPKTRDPAARAARIVRLRASGLTLREIGARVGLSGQMVKVLLNGLGHPTQALPDRPAGFASLTGQQRREIARKGGQTAQAGGKGYRWDSEAAVEAGRKGGKATQARGTGYRFNSETGRAAGKKGGRGKWRTERRG
jgi:general stress protein YciG